MWRPFLVTPTQSVLARLVTICHEDSTNVFIVLLSSHIDDVIFFHKATKRMVVVGHHWAAFHPSNYKILEELKPIGASFGRP
jgi:hypothetical protein